MTPQTLPVPDPAQIVATTLFALALAHTFATRHFERLAQRFPRHAGLLHLLGEVEVVFGFWALVLLLALAALDGRAAALRYAETRDYTEPLFVFVVMVIAGSRPVLATVLALVDGLAGWLPAPRRAAATVWLGLALVPLLGSLVTEPAAMTIAALLLAPRVFHPGMPERLKYLALGTLFVNVSIGGTLTAYAAPPVLMVADVWGWTSAHLFNHFGWKAACAVLVNASLATALLRRHLPLAGAGEGSALAPAVEGDRPPVPWALTAVHLGLLAGVVLLAHHPVAFLGLFLLFLGIAQAYERHQNPLLLREALLVAFFLAGLVLLGGLQSWWLAPLVAGLEPLALFFGSVALTAVTDNAALTYLGAQIPGLSAQAQYLLVAGAVTGGGLTVIANAPNPAGAALLRPGFADRAIGAGGLLLGALLPTVVALAAFLWL
ncbi:MAG TPA: putative Na+/H+ antiporter [Burkholderiaceae bacterium]|nr:putative Na+/H+ antiporter [Burkholderiaceae bacterium]HNB46375.1 putative Na+/H+ antiporter [Burkholderiaceae bacterium]HNG82009.1 putative Na+/H+ antiporter [Burkholderiaceae bacterium]